MSSDSDFALVERARSGDVRAFQCLFERHARPLHAVCARLLGDATAAEDAVQEAFIKAHRRLQQFDGRAAFSTWLHRIAVNTSIEMLRRRRSASDDGEEQLAETVDIHADPSAGVSQTELVRTVGAALQELTTLERSVFVLRHLEQRSLHEIALLLSSNVNACKQAIFRAVRKLRAQLAHLEASVP